MFRKFSGGQKAGNRAMAGESVWPRDKVVSALENQYGALDQLGEEGPLSVFGVQHNGVNFVIALMESAPGSGKIIELGFLARFVGFEIDAQLVETINRNLHLGVASIEANGDLFLMAGMQPVGSFDAGHFALVLEAWRRDLMITLHGLSSGQASMAAAFPAAKLEAARNFAMNVAPAPTDNKPVDLLACFLGAKNSRELCGDCSGRGKRGFIARECVACDGSGFVKAH